VSIGFTGTRSGMTQKQIEVLRQYLIMFRVEYGLEFRHGVAEGADLQAAALAVGVGYVEEKFPAGDDPLGRNRVIVDGSHLMFATPHQHKEVLRSGTWATIRYTNKTHTPGITIWPDGNSTPMLIMNHLLMR
jgi:hypothetical protein